VGFVLNTVKDAPTWDSVWQRLAAPLTAGAIGAAIVSFAVGGYLWYKNGSTIRRIKDEVKFDSYVLALTLFRSINHPFDFSLIHCSASAKIVSTSPRSQIAVLLAAGSSASNRGSVMKTYTMALLAGVAIGAIALQGLI
jgi:hypothetical protein